ncbi:MAG: SPOR domain-containing protein [Bacteroidaceae bacterium]|nr:SPOR domain-containing protein [Bacteroidaceae bacterium]
MKKTFFIVVALCSAFVFTSCKSKDSLYKTAYDEARMQQENEVQAQEDEAVEIAPVASSTTKVSKVDDSYRSEKVVLASGVEGSLKAFSVVCGSFGQKANAETVRAELIDEGYEAIIVQSPKGLFRVVCASFDSRQEAAEARAQFKADHPNNADYQKAWLLYNN